jgi:hypothetical protein
VGDHLTGFGSGASSWLDIFLIMLDRFLIKKMIPAAGTPIKTGNNQNTDGCLPVVVNEVVAFVSIAKPLFSTPGSHDLCCFWNG